MKKITMLVAITTGLGFVLSTIGIVLLIVGSQPFFPEFSISYWIVHPLLWMIISGIPLFSILASLLAKRQGKDK